MDTQGQNVSPWKWVLGLIFFLLLMAPTGFLLTQ